MDNRIHYYLVIDTETANSLDFPMVYDIGGAVIDARGRIYETFSFTIRDIFVYERELMQTAYYANKIPSYVREHHEGTRKMVDFYEARQHILNLMHAYNITDVCAYNANFDRNALNTTQRWLTKSKYRYFSRMALTLFVFGIWLVKPFASAKHTKSFAKLTTSPVTARVRPMPAIIAQARKQFTGI